ncbi:hypothetical protein AM10699_66260 (plasmid) [Acaryochloris marina MBIC10699]|nr:hypothetical protein AM10699_66260 [Acaryochloris marina MBIC10699]
MRYDDNRKDLQGEMTEVLSGLLGGEWLRFNGSEGSRWKADRVKLRVSTQPIRLVTISQFWLLKADSFGIGDQLIYYVTKYSS